MTGVTVKVKFLTSCKLGDPLSIRVMLKFDEPFASSAGVNVAVQFGAVPP